MSPVPTPVPTATLIPGFTPKVDPSISGKVPSAAVSYALANPAKVRGWGLLLNPAVPFHPLYNPHRTCLTLTNPGVPYAPVFNDLVFKAGCP